MTEVETPCDAVSVQQVVSEAHSVVGVWRMEMYTYETTLEWIM